MNTGIIARGSHTEGRWVAKIWPWISWINFAFGVDSSRNNWSDYVVPRSRDRSKVLKHTQGKTSITILAAWESKWKLNSAPKNYLIPNPEIDPPIILSKGTLAAKELSRW